MDWIEFLQVYDVEYVTRGPNTKQGEISIKCPFCGEDDPSEHMGISLTHNRWGCHRDQEHRGASLWYLIANIVGCSASQAKLLEKQFSAADPDNLDAALEALQAEATHAEPLCGEPSQPEPVVFPTQCRPIAPMRFNQPGIINKAWTYIRQRGFTPVTKFCEYYDIHYATTGRWKDRIIIPVYQEGRLMGWTARAVVNPKNTPRYLTSGPEIKQLVFNEDKLIKEGGHTLVITEGPFDAMKLDWYGRQHGLRATCTFGTTFTFAQIAILTKLLRRFPGRVIMFDNDAPGPSFHIRDWLINLGVHTMQVPFQARDPGDLEQADVLQLAAKCEDLVPYTA